ncbi:hypothetical protein APT59_12910 [Pseudomonas oryzihabitans]|uniref:LrgB family protein n=1 Tax=Pseudomonas oryzihabitans TaxID=47885 RepID=A0A0U4W5I2_9PSED|nr:LrgB family protein [Pseudomonas oryzihabitans]ALZ85046.1 hypothetical protein APT59_12910 [Pseudomonas oryzihabitans]
MADPYLAPLLALSVTLAAYQVALLLQQRLRLVMLQPVLITTALVASLLWAASVPYEHYRSASGTLSLLLGPTTVGLAVPLYRNIQRVISLSGPLLITLSVGGVVGVTLTLALGWLFGLSPTLVMSLAPKSVTMPIALPLSGHFGGLVSLTAVIVMLTGVISTTLALPLLKLFKVEDPAARGLTLGMNGHAIGTAHALREGQETAAFSALGMILLGIATAVLLPVALAV